MVSVPVEEMNADVVRMAVVIGHKFCPEQFLSLPGWREIMDL